MYMIWFGMAFNKPNAFLATQIMRYFPKTTPQFSI